MIAISKGADNTNRLHYSDLGNPLHPAIGAPVKAVFEEDGAEFRPIRNVGGVLYARTDRGSPAEANWKTIIPESRNAIENVSVIGGRIVAQYLVDVQSHISLFGLDGGSQGEIPLPGAGAVMGISGREDTPEMFCVFSSPLYPETVFEYDPKSRQQRPFEAATSPVDVTQYETKALFATSKDGTRVPFFLTWRKGSATDGSHPTMLYGYGGFSISMLPFYNPDVPAWRRRGVRRGVAPGRPTGEQAEGIGRLHRGGRAAHQRPIHIAGETGDHGRHQRWIAHRRGGGATPGSVRFPR